MPGRIRKFILDPGLEVSYQGPDPEVDLTFKKISIIINIRHFTNLKILKSL
jgi:hypothetical protein